LQLSRASFAELYEFAPVGYFTLNENGRIQQVNLRGARLVGRERQELLEMWFADQVASGSHALFAQHLWEVFKGRRRHQCGLTLQKADGSSASVQLVSALASHAPDEPRFCRMAVVDASYRKKAEAALRAAHESLEMRVLERTRELSETNH